MRIQRSILDPILQIDDYDARINGDDKGLINAWYVGRRLADKSPDLAARARNGELPVLGVKGGISKKIKVPNKFGSLWYVAQWQGLRGEDLNVDTDAEIVMRCSRFGVEVLFTLDLEKLGRSQDD